MMSARPEFHYYCTTCYDNVPNASSTCSTCQGKTTGYFTVLPLESQVASIMSSNFEVHRTCTCFYCYRVCSSG